MTVFMLVLLCSPLGKGDGGKESAPSFAKPTHHHTSNRGPLRGDAWLSTMKVVVNTDEDDRQAAVHMVVGDNIRANDDPSHAPTTNTKDHLLRPSSTKKSPFLSRHSERSVNVAMGRRGITQEENANVDPSFLGRSGSTVSEDGTPPFLRSLPGNRRRLSDAANFHEGESSREADEEDGVLTSQANGETRKQGHAGAYSTDMNIDIAKHLDLAAMLGTRGNQLNYDQVGVADPRALYGHPSSTNRPEWLEGQHHQSPRGRAMNHKGHKGIMEHSDHGLVVTPSQVIVEEEDTADPFSRSSAFIASETVSTGLPQHTPTRAKSLNDVSASHTREEPFIKKADGVESDLVTGDGEVEMYFADWTTLNCISTSADHSSVFYGTTQFFHSIEECCEEK